MPNTLTLIQKITVGATVSSGVTFSNIPQGYSDLKVFGSVRSNVGNPGDFIYLYLNNPGTGAYTQRFLRGDGSSASSGNNSVSYYPLQFINGGGSTANTFGNFEIYIPNYTSSNQKSFSVDILSENNSTTAYADIQAGLWNQTAAVTGITLNSGSGNFVQHSTFYLYGIAKFGVSTPSTAAAYATGGDDITTDGTYWIHTFKSSGTFRPLKALSNVDYLVVAGGGGGSNSGGGAGGYRTSTGTSGANSAAESKLSMLTNTNYTVTVGAGGASRTNGSNSVLSGSGITTITSVAGGGGNPGFGILPGQNGGSGGGGRGSGNAGGTGTANQGSNGGAGNSSAAGGGGGASAVGTNASTSDGGAGGNGLANSISGSSISRGGGGGGAGSNSGGLGGTGGGGRAEITGVTAAESGVANTGGGGGGSWAVGSTQAGGSGIVIVRYPV